LCRACKISAALHKAQLTPTLLLTAEFYPEFSSFAVLADSVDPAPGRAVHSGWICEGSLSADCLVGTTSGRPRDSDSSQTGQQQRFTWAQTVINRGDRGGETRQPHSTAAHRHYAATHLRHRTAGSSALLPARPTFLSLMVRAPHATISPEVGVQPAAQRHIKPRCTAGASRPHDRCGRLVGSAATHHLRRGRTRATHPHHEGCSTAVASGPNRTATLSARHLLLSSRQRRHTSRPTASWSDDEDNKGIDEPLWRDRAGDGA